MLSAGDVVDVHVASERNDGYLATRRGDHVQVLAWEGECPYGYRVCLGGHEPWGWLDAGVLKPLEGSEQFEVLVSAERLDGYLVTRKGDRVEILHVEAVWVYAKRLDDGVVGWVGSNTLNTVTRTNVSYTALQPVAGGQLALANPKQEVSLCGEESDQAKRQGLQAAKPIVKSKEPRADKSQEATLCTVNVAQALYPDPVENLTTNEDSIKLICAVAGIPEIRKGDIWRSLPNAHGLQRFPVAFEYTEPSPHGLKGALVPYNHELSAAIDVQFVLIQGDPGVAIKVYRPGKYVWINVFRYNRARCKPDMFLRYVKHQVLTDEAVQIKQASLSQEVPPFQMPEPKIEMSTPDSSVQGTYSKVPENDCHVKEVFWCTDTNKLVFGDGTPAVQAEADLIANYKPSLPLKPGWIPIWYRDKARRYFVNLYTSTWTPPYATLPEYTPDQLQEMGSRAAVAAGTIKVGGVPYKAPSSHVRSGCTTYASGNRLPEIQDQRWIDKQGMLHERYTLAVKGAGLRSKDLPHVEFSKSATYVLRHKRDRQKKVIYNDKNGFMAWDTFVRLFSNEVSKRLSAMPQYLIHFDSPHQIIDVLERAVKDVERFEVEYLTNPASGYCRPIMIRALQGHSSDDAPHELIAETRVEVTEKNVRVIYHGTSKIGAKNIVRTGQIIPGGGPFSVHQHERKESYFSILHPVTGVARASPRGDPVQYRPYDFHRGVIIHINLQKARQRGCSFWQARSSALTCSGPVPVEAVELYEDAGDY